MARSAISPTRRPAKSQFRNAFLLGCAGAWSLHPSQIAIAKHVFSPDPAEVAFARRVLEAMPDGTGAVMIDGRMQDDATWKQCQGDRRPRPAGRGEGPGLCGDLRLLTALDLRSFATSARSPSHKAGEALSRALHSRR